MSDLEMSIHPVLFPRLRLPIPVAMVAAACLMIAPVGAGRVAVAQGIDVAVSDNLQYRQAMAQAVRAAAQRVLPSVVMVELIGTAGVGPGEVEQDAPTSGVIVDTRGYVIASSIVVRRPAVTTLVVLPDGSRHTAKVIARDHHRDLVLLKIETSQPLVAVALGDQPGLQIGQTTVAVGRYGSDVAPMVSKGILSATERLDGIALQSDARVSPALYGGPLVDLYGNVLGVLIPAVAEGGAEDATSWYDSGIAFAIPADVIAKNLPRLIEGQDIKKGLIGIVAKSQDPNDEGTEIAAVRSRSPAETAGIKAGDEVLSVNEIPVRRHQQIRQALGRFDSGDDVALVLRRDGEQISVELTLTDSIPPLQPQRIGIIARQESAGDGEDDDDDVDDDADKQSNQVIVQDVLPKSPAEQHLRPGDVITKLGETEISDVQSLRRQLISAEPDKPLVISYARDGQPATATLTPSSIAGESLPQLPKSWTDPDDQAWVAESIQLPDAPNQAAYLAPPADTQRDDLGLLVLLLNPGESAPLEFVGSWKEAAQQAGVVVCAIAAEEDGRWQPKELEVVANFTAAVLKKAPIHPAAVAVAASGALDGEKAEAADAMALATAISQSKTFFGVAISAQTQPPAVRLRENEPAAALQIMMPITSDDQLPPWAPAIQSAGYPIVRGGQVQQSDLLRWARLLQAI